MKEEGRGGGSELGSDLDLDPGTRSKLFIILWIRIRQIDTDPLDSDPQYWSILHSTYTKKPMNDSIKRRHCKFAGLGIRSFAHHS